MMAMSNTDGDCNRLSFVFEIKLQVIEIMKAMSDLYEIS